MPIRILLTVLLIAIAGGTASAGPPLSGRLLVAAPEMVDPNFRETVVLIVEHDAAGAFGLILNKVVGRGSLSELMAAFGVDTASMDPHEAERQVALRRGGPVQRDLVFVLHSPDFAGENGEVVIDGVVLNQSADVLEATVAGSGPRQALYLVGYAGWAADQLDREINRGDWLDAPAAAPVVFGSAPEEMWRNVMEAAGLSL